mmetsp:Transcript_13754/g.23441  ORF Transcript_13754/g.23441 Transcript_13754/m.23441 type:complete len:217 (+) Transcript_13754:1318-1968(+)
MERKQSLPNVHHAVKRSVAVWEQDGVLVPGRRCIQSSSLAFPFHHFFLGDRRDGRRLLHWCSWLYTNAHILHAWSLFLVPWGYDLVCGRLGPRYVLHVLHILHILHALHVLHVLHIGHVGTHVRTHGCRLVKHKLTTLDRRNNFLGGADGFGLFQSFQTSNLSSGKRALGTAWTTSFGHTIGTGTGAGSTRGSRHCEWPNHWLGKRSIGHHLGRVR